MTTTDDRTPAANNGFEEMRGDGASPTISAFNYLCAGGQFIAMKPRTSQTRQTLAANLADDPTTTDREHK